MKCTTYGSYLYLGCLDVKSQGSFRQPEFTEAIFSRLFSFIIKVSKRSQLMHTYIYKKKSHNCIKIIYKHMVYSLENVTKPAAAISPVTELYFWHANMNIPTVHMVKANMPMEYNTWPTYKVSESKRKQNIVSLLFF